MATWILPCQLQPQPPPQQPPPPDDGVNDFAEAPLADPFVELKTDNWIEFCLLAGQYDGLAATMSALVRAIFSALRAASRRAIRGWSML